MKKNFFTGLTALVLAIGFVLTGCESPTAGDAGGQGNPGGAGVNSPNIVSTFAGIEDAFAEGNAVVYLVKAVDVERDLTLKAGQSLVVTTTADLRERSVAGESTGSLTIPANKTLTVAGGKLTVNTGATLAVAENGLLLGGASGELAIDAGATLTLDAKAGVLLGSVTTTNVAGAWKTALTEKATTGSARTTATDSAIAGLLATDGVTMVVYGGTAEIPSGSPKTVPAGKTLRAVGITANQTANLTVDGTLVVSAASITAFSGALTLGDNATVVLSGAVGTLGAGAIAIGEGATLTLENTTTLSGIVSGKGALTLNRAEGTAITAAFASTGADTFNVGGTGAVSTDKETNIVKLLAGFNTVTYSGGTAIPADVGTALTSAKTLKTTGTISSQTTLTLGGGTLSIEDNAITWGGDTVLGGTGLITTDQVGGLVLGAITTNSNLSYTGALTTTGSGTITYAHTDAAVLAKLAGGIALAEGATRTVTGPTTTSGVENLTVAKGVDITMSGAAFAPTGTLTVNGTLTTSGSSALATGLTELVVDEGGVLTAGGSGDTFAALTDLTVNGTATLGAATFTLATLTNEITVGSKGVLALGAIAVPGGNITVDGTLTLLTSTGILRIAQNKALTVNGTLIVGGSDATTADTNALTLTKAVIESKSDTADGLVITGSSGIALAFDGAADVLKLDVGGAIAGKGDDSVAITAAATTIKGLWTNTAVAQDAAAGTDYITVTATSADEATIAGTAKVALVGGAAGASNTVGLISQGTGSGKILNIAANTTINIGASGVGIGLSRNSDPSTVKFLAASSWIVTGVTVTGSDTPLGGSGAGDFTTTTSGSNNNIVVSDGAIVHKDSTGNALIKVGGAANAIIKASTDTSGASTDSAILTATSACA